jgi:hypothetical protein
MARGALELREQDPVLAFDSAQGNDEQHFGGRRAARAFCGAATPKPPVTTLW